MCFLPNIINREKKMKSLRAVVLASALAFGFGAQAATTIVPSSALVASTTYYTDLIGGGSARS